MENEGTLALALNDKLSDTKDVKLSSEQEDCVSSTIKAKGDVIKCEESALPSTAVVAPTVKDEQLMKQAVAYEEHPMNLVKKIKLDKDESHAELLLPMEACKENVSEDAPIDLSSGTKRKDTKLSRKSAIERLRDELCNEETTLLLLKKLQRSQMVHRSQDSGKSNEHSVFKSPVPTVPTSKPVPIPPPLVRQQPVMNQPVNQTVQSRTEPPRVSPYGQSPNMQHTNMHSAMRGPPPMLSAPRPAIVRPTVPSEPPPAPRPTINVPTPEQTLAQSKDAAKLALRRQLEATLLQIPPPKPAALAVNFIPSIGSNVEFVSLVGLEEVVSCIASQEATPGNESGTPTLGETRKPFQCAHCETDFTPVWRRSQTGVDEILCERCAITAQKRMLKQEHTARLKAAFMHALQQEREIEASSVLPASTALTTVRPSAIASDPKMYPGMSQQHSRSVPSFQAMTDPRMLPVSTHYGLMAGMTGASRQQFGAFSHRSDHQLMKRMN